MIRPPRPTLAEVPLAGLSQASLKDFDHEGFEEKCEPGTLCSPWRNDRLHPVLRTPAARKTGDDLGDKLHGVQMPPPSLFGVSGQPTGSSTF